MREVAPKAGERKKVWEQGEETDADDAFGKAVNDECERPRISHEFVIIVFKVRW